MIDSTPQKKKDKNLIDGKEYMVWVKIDHKRCKRIKCKFVKKTNSFTYTETNVVDADDGILWYEDMPIESNLTEIKKVEELKKLINSKKSTIKKFCEWLEPYSSKHLTEGFKMPKLRDIIAYICKNSKNKNELSDGRVTKMVYLADWKFCIEYGKQITDIKWTFNHYGPYVEDVQDSIKNDSDFSTDIVLTAYGSPKKVIHCKSTISYPTLTKEIEKILDFVITKTEDLPRNQFINLVYNTYPVLTQPKYSTLKLPKLADEYKKIQSTDIPA